MPKSQSIVLLLALTLLGAVPSAARTTTYSLEAGYQFVDVDGNGDLYRTQVNQEDGLVLRNFNFTLFDPKAEGGMFDRLRIDAAGFGGNPNGRFNMDAGLGKVYRLTLHYSHLENFSALPALANPFYGEGVIPGQHTFDRKRDLVSLELQLMPGRALTPILGYRWNRFDGPRRTTYFVGQDEFRLTSDLQETESEFYAGLSFNASGFTGTLLQGWRTYKATDHLALAPGAGGGNNTAEVLGRSIFADSYSRSDRIEGDTPMTNLFVTGTFFDKLNLRATFARADAETEASSGELLSGSLASFQIDRFFAGLDASVRSRAESPSWRGEVRAAYEVTGHFNVDVGYQMRDTKLDGWALVTSLYTDTHTFGGLDAGDLSLLAEMRNSLERKQEIADVTFNLTDLGPFKVWAGGALDTQDLTLHEDAAEIVVPGSQEGTFDREIDRYFAGASANLFKGTLLLDYQTEDADTPVLRTDFTTRDRARLRVKYPVAGLFELFGTAENIKSDNLDSGIGYKAETKHYAVEAALTPVQNLAFRAAWDSFKTDSSIPIRRPYDFGVEMSLFSDDGTMLEGSVEWTGSPFGFQAGYSTLENDGTFLFQLDRAFARCTYDFSKSLSAGLEYEHHKYAEDLFSAADFTASRYAIFLRVH